VAEALNTGKLRAAAVDVVTVEPILPTNPLLTAKNCIITPHMSWAATEARARIVDITAANIRAFEAGTPQNVVNP
jgi:glycerate dehydrogenase